MDFLTKCVEEFWSAKFRTKDRICGVTLYVRLKLNRLRATAAARRIASRIYRCSLTISSHNKSLKRGMMNAILY
jgi:hypothetical protein